MRNPKLLFLLFIMLFSLPVACRLQTSRKQAMNSQELVHREPIGAGSYYPSKPAELKSFLEELFTQAEARKTRNEVLAILAPHAGYIFSGSVAASSYNQLNTDMEYENIFIIGSSHHVGFDGASVYNKGHYITPLGKVEVNLGLAKDLISRQDCFTYKPDAHTQEHSLEVQMPFLQHHLSKAFRIVPIVIGTQDPRVCKKIAQALLPYFKTGNLFVISTDFSHYPGYEDAKTVDKQTASAILANSPAKLLRTLQENEQKNIPGLLTSMCGWSSVLTLLYMTEHNRDIEIIPIDYKNSGDSEYGDPTSVVGYYSICVTRKEEKSEGFRLDEKDREILLGIARETLEQYIKHQAIPDFNPKKYSDNLLTPAGAFVTLHKDGALRGCIGQFEPAGPLYEVVRDMAISAATRDYRFLPVNAIEVEEVEIEISVLSPMKKINSIDEIVLGKHGIYIAKGQQSGTFLPQVATQTGWNLEEFLGHCAQDKARIGWEGWKEADIYIYEAYVFGE